MPQRDLGGRRDDDGFTLVELLITIVVMGILVGIVVMGVAQFRGDSVNSACEADKQIVSSAATAFELKQGTFPKDIEELETMGYVKDPAPGVTYTFEDGEVQQAACKL